MRVTERNTNNVNRCIDGLATITMAIRTVTSGGEKKNMDRDMEYQSKGLNTLEFLLKRGGVEVGISITQR